MNSRAQHVEVSRTGVGQRLDNYLLRIWKGVPRSHVYRLSVYRYIRALCYKPPIVAGTGFFLKTGDPNLEESKSYDLKEIK